MCASWCETVRSSTEHVDNVNIAAPGVTMDLRCAVIIPCFNEEVTIGKVIQDVRTVLPKADIYVFDNNSTDRTAQLAEEAGAAIVREKRQGKGFVVQTMFSRVDADIYVMVDGDDTYDLHQLPEMVEMIEHDDADMVVGSLH
jgi:glycosyltransferase involved in cell wall biosynthesis